MRYEKNLLVEDVVDLTLKLLSIPSVSGDCAAVMDVAERELRDAGLAPTRRTAKDAVLAVLRGRDDDRQRVVAAHLDTLGAVVHEIKDNGRLRLYPIGGYDWRSFEGENCTVHTLDGAAYDGTLLPARAARHATPIDKRDEPRTEENVEVRLDVMTSSKEATEALGIHAGDIVSFEPRSVVTETGFIKSRFLDDKLSVAILLTAVRDLRRRGVELPYTTHVYLSNYEEIGHGTPAIPPRAEEVAALDIGVVAEGTASSEHAVTILSRDGALPYDRRMVRQLKALAEANDIPYRIDAYQNYGSDASACLKAGKDVRALCFGPAAEATHSYERTHADSIDAALRLLTAYLTAPMAS